MKCSINARAAIGKEISIDDNTTVAIASMVFLFTMSPLEFDWLSQLGCLRGMLWARKSKLDLFLLALLGMPLVGVGLPLCTVCT